jgi:manganese/zinc/iron transport system substrate-binding protein
MGRFIFICLSLLGLITCGCQSQGNPSVLDTWARENKKVKVLSTTCMIDDLVAFVGGDRIDHLALIVGEMDPHSYELVKGDSEKFESAHVIFYSGLGLEHGASLHYQLKHHPHAFGLGDFLLAHYPEEIIEVEGQVDPHVWMDISLWSKTVDLIAKALTEADPEAEAFYLRNAEELQARMKEAHLRIYEDMQAVPQKKRYIVTSHDAFNYFTRAYLATPEEVAGGSWRQRFDAPEGLAPEGQLGLVDIQQVIDHLKNCDVHVVFPESNVSRDSLKKIVCACTQTGFRVKIAPEVLYGDSMGPVGSSAATYLGMMQYDASVLKKQWDEE